MRATEHRFRAVAPAVREAARDFRRQPTPAEALLWERLRDRRLHGLKFRRQHALLGFVLDFYCPRHNLAIEVDGAVHAEPTQHARDAERSQQLAAAGVRVLRLSNAAILGTIDQFLAAIAAACGIETPPPTPKSATE